MTVIRLSLLMRVVNSVSDKSLDHISDAVAHWDMV